MVLSITAARNKTRCPPPTPSTHTPPPCGPPSPALDQAHHVCVAVTLLAGGRAVLRFSWPLDRGAARPTVTFQGLPSGLAVRFSEAPGVHGPVHRESIPICPSAQKLKCRSFSSRMMNGSQNAILAASPQKLKTSSVSPSLFLISYSSSSFLICKQKNHFCGKFFLTSRSVDGEKIPFCLGQEAPFLTLILS